MISDVPVWRIDTRWFDGRPQVRHRSSADTLQLELRNAFFPGTHLPPDLILSARRRANEWHARFKLEGLNFTAGTRFQMWLLGLEPAHGSMRVETLAIASAKPMALAGLGGPAAFRPNWTISSDQLVSGRLQLHDQVAALDAFHFSLHVSEEPELPPSATSRHWVSLASGSKLSFDTRPAQLDIGPASAQAFVEARSESAILVVEAGPSGDNMGPATLMWRAAGQVALSAGEALGKIDFTKTGTASSGSALLGGLLLWTSRRRARNQRK